MVFVRKALIIVFIINCYSFSQSRILYAPEMYVDLRNVESWSTHYFDLINLGVSYCFDWNDIPYEIIVGCNDCGTNCNDCDGGLEEDGVDADANGYAHDQDGYGYCALGLSTASPHFGYGILFSKKYN